MTNNKHILSEFKRLLYQINYDIEVSKSTAERNKNLFRLKSINASINIIKKFNKNLHKPENLKELSLMNGIGPGTIRRIKEIIKTNKLKEIEIDNKNIKYVEELTNVFGIGYKYALKLINEYNIKNVNELKKAAKNNIISLSRSITLGLKYYKTFREHIARSEMKKHNTYLKKIVCDIDKNLIIKVCGSYRRKMPFSNDIDCVLSYKNINANNKNMNNKNYLKILITKLKENNYILDEITQTYDNKFLGFCQGNNYVRRIDIEYVNYESYFTALFYFTGSKRFNQKIRSIAKQNGYKLNEFGLYKNDKKITVNSEKDIFDELNIEYIKPENREI